MADPKPPRPTTVPQPYADQPETVTGVHRAVKHDINWLKAINIGVIVSAVGISFGAYRALAADSLDAGTRAAAEAMREAKAADAKADATQRELIRFQTETSNRFDRMEQGQQRTDKKLDALLNAQGVWNPAPAPRDGGR